MKIENWKTEFKKLEDAENWDPALELLLKVIKENSDEKDAYIFMHYFFMNLFLEADDYDLSKNEYYKSICLEYFKIAYEKYENDAEYLFWTSNSICQCPWYFGIYCDDNKYKRMAEKACFLDPRNILYKSYFYSYVFSATSYIDKHVLEIENESYVKNYLNILSRKEKLEMFIYGTMIKNKNSEIRREIDSKGSLGEYFLKMQNYTINCFFNYEEL